MLVSFNANPDHYQHDNSYVISRQGKPPDLVMEIASRNTGTNDTQRKPPIYAALGVAEYWRFDETGEYHHTKLAGDRLVQDQYQPIPIDTLPDGTVWGYSAALNLILEWNDGQLNWIEPETEQHIPTLETEREGRLAEQEGRRVEREGRLQAEARNRKLEAEVGSGTPQAQRRVTRHQPDDLCSHRQNACTGETAHTMTNLGTQADTVREQRAIIRNLRRNYPDGERRIALADGAVAKYEQGAHKGKTVEVYALPCDEFQCNIDLLRPSVIDPQATRALWLQDPPEDEEPPAHWH